MNIAVCIKLLKWRLSVIQTFDLSRKAHLLKGQTWQDMYKNSHTLKQYLAPGAQEEAVSLVENWWVEKVDEMSEEECFLGVFSPSPTQAASVQSGF